MGVGDRISSVNLSSFLTAFILSLCVCSTAISQHTITYCVDPDWLPYEGIESGEHVGISSDYIRLLQDISGHRFILIPTRSWSESLSLARSGQCQMIPMLNSSPEREEFLVFSEPYFVSPKVLVSKTDFVVLKGLDSPDLKTVAVIGGYRVIEYLQENHPNLKQVVVDSEQQGLEAVLNDEADVFIGSTLSVNNEVLKRDIRNLKITGWNQLEDELRIGLTLKESELLPSINQALSKITVQQHTDIFNSWNQVRVIDNTNYSLVWKIIAASAAMLTLLLAGFLSSRKYNKQLMMKNKQLLHLQHELEVTNEELRIQSSRDALTSLFNRHYINQIIENPRYTYVTISPMALIVIDLDYFKNVNDTYGHTAGDKVLIELSLVLKEHTDDSHVLARWGGEEFIIFCKQQTIDDANRLCEVIQNSIKTYPFSYIKSISCSFGVAELQPGESLSHCFKRADYALYQAKANGRDRIILASSA